MDFKSMIEIERKENVGPPHAIRWLAFIGWLVLPILATWGVVEMTSLIVLWWGMVWFGFALVYLIVYFRWSRKTYPKP
jgi:hypothetical protein